MGKFPFKWECFINLLISFRYIFLFNLKSFILNEVSSVVGMIKFKHKSEYEKEQLTVYLIYDIYFLHR